MAKTPSISLTDVENAATELKRRGKPINPYQIFGNLLKSKKIMINGDMSMKFSSSKLQSDKQIKTYRFG